MRKAADILEKTTQSAAEGGSAQKYLTFFVDGQLYAVPSSQVMEIIRMQPITYMPKMPPFVKGIINLRGKIVPLIDLAMRFGKPLIEYDDRTSIIVAETEEYNVGFIVAAVNDVADIYSNQVSDSPALAKGYSNRYITGIATLESTVAMLLDIDKVLKDTSDGSAE